MYFVLNVNYFFLFIQNLLPILFRRQAKCAQLFKFPICQDCDNFNCKYNII